MFILTGESVLGLVGVFVQRNNEIVCVETSWSGCFKTNGKVWV